MTTPARPTPRLRAERLEDRVTPATLSNFLTTSHVDLNVGYAGGAWTLQPRDDDNGGVSYPADDALLVVGADTPVTGGTAPAAVVRPAGSEFDFLGVTAGTTYYRLPQSQDPNLLYLGVAGYGVTASAFDRYDPAAESKGRVTGNGRWIKVSLVDVKYTDPAGVVGTGGKFSVWQSGDTGPVVFMSNTDDGTSNPNGQGLDATDGIGADDALWVVAGGHIHYNYGFTQKGRYEVTVKVSGYAGDDGLSTPNVAGFTQSQTITLYFSVGSLGQFQFATADTDVAESAGTATVTVNRVGGSDGRVTVNYATTNGTATAGQDYTAASGALTFNDGETTKTITIPIADDAAQEGDETINLTLSNPGPASIADYTVGLPAGGLLGSPSAGTVTILANDTTFPPTISDAPNQTTAEDTPHAVGYTVGDPDTPLGQLVLSATSSNPALVPNTSAALAFTGSGASRTLTVTPAANAAGTATITVTVADGTGGTVSDSFVLTVTPVNDAPTAAPQSVTATENTPKTVTLVGTDPENDPLTYVVVTGPAHGTLTGTGANRTYTPAAGYNGPDSFTFRVNDGQLDSAPATVSITVAAVNDPPTATSQAMTTTEDTPTAVVLSGTDPESDPLTYSIVSAPAHGTLTGSGANRTYTPAPNYTGLDSFTFLVNDGTTDSAPATVSITVAAANDPPTATPQTVAAVEDTARAITLAGADIESDPLTYVVVTGPAHGTLTGTGANRTYTPAAGYNGPDSFTFRVNDGQLDSAPATVSITVAAVNDPPTATPDAFGVTPGNVIRGTVLSNDADIDGDALAAAVTTGPSAGTLSLAANGSFTYTPGVAFAGADSFTYSVSDGRGGMATAVVTITARPAEPAFDATLTEGHVDVGLAYEGDAFDPHVHDEESDTEYASDRALLAVKREALANRPAGAAFDFLGVPAGAIYWRLPQTQNPELLLLGFGTEEIESGVFAGDTVTFQLVGVDGPGQFSVWRNTDDGPEVLMSTADGITAADSPALLAGGHDDLNWGFTAAGLYAVTLRPVGTLADGTPVTGDPATYYFRVAPNAVPLAADDAFGLTPGNVLRGTVLADDTDTDGDALTTTIVTPTAHGSVVLSPDGSFSYTPNATFAGTDSFTYTAADGFAGGAATATVTITGRPAYPAFQAVLSEGHADVGIAYEDDAFDPHIHDEVNDVEYAPGEAVYHARPQAATARPAGAAFDFIGAPAGATYYRLPQTQVGDLLYLGFGAEELEAGVFAGDQVFNRLLAVDGPGQFSAWENTDSGPNVVFSTADGITAADTATVPAGGHFHVNWGFTAPGLYAITLQLSGTLADGTEVTGEPATYYFAVDPPNPAPVQQAPAAVVTTRDVPVAFTGASVVRVNDAAPTDGTYRVELVATNGTVSLPATPGVTVTTGTGANDTRVVIEGALAAVNGALAGLAFTPAAGFTGAASVVLTTTDPGALVGAENPRADTDTITVTVAPPPAPRAPEPIAVGTGTGGTARLVGGDGKMKLTLPYGATYTGEVRVATGDVTGDGIPDLITGTGPGAAPHVKVFDAVTGAEVLSLFAFEASFTGGVFVAAGDLDGDGRAEIVVSPDESGGPRVVVFSPAGRLLASFLGIDDANFRGGVRVAVGDVNGDGTPDVVVAAGFGGGPRVAVFDGETVTTTPTRLVNDFFAFEPGLRNGAFVAAGDVDGDGFDDLVFGAGPGGAPRVLVLDGAALLVGDVVPLADLFAGDAAGRAGVRVAAPDTDADGRAELVAGSADDGTVSVYRVTDAGVVPTGETNWFEDSLGVYVG